MEETGKVLLVDEARFFLAIERQFLRKAPVEVLEAASGEDAWRLLTEHRPGLAFLAFQLGDLTGDELCRRIKASPQLRETAVILVCEANRSEQTARARQAGCDGLLTKPLDRHKFLELGSQFAPSIRTPRQPCLIPLSVVTDAQSFPGKCLDISTGGLFLQTAEKLAEGNTVGFEFKLDSAEGETICCSGVVAWINHREDPFKPHYPVGYGVRFTGISARAKQLIGDYIDGRNGGR